MSPVMQDSIVKTAAAVFVGNACSVFKDMMNVEFVPEQKFNRQSPFTNGFVAVSHFYGAVQGDFMMSTDEMTVSKIAGVYNPDDSVDIMVKNREIYASMMCEVLNISAHQSLAGLETTYGKLILLPPSWVFGEYHTVEYISGVGSIDSLYGSIVCTFSLNNAGFNSF